METKKCQQCKKKKPATKFSLIHDGIRQKVCRACNYDGTTADQKHKIIREAYRHYLTFEQYVTDTGKDVIEYAVPKEQDSDEFVSVTISFTDLQRALKQFNGELQKEGTVLSKRKEQAFYLNVIRDLLQRDVADIMGITTVSVGQYVEQGMQQLCDYYFGEEKLDTEDTRKVQEARA
jgi:DNA-directed RNA polymerase specialized sigma24 family protein